MTMDYYRGMLIQSTRIEAFRRQISAVVRPGDRVLEIGSGLGTYAFFAAAAGASKVWAVEGAPVINVAKAIGRANGYENRVEFIRGWFPGVAIPQPVDVLIFEDFSPRLLDQWTYSVLSRLHHDVLKPGARIIPDHARMFLAPVHLNKVWQTVSRFGDDEDTAFGIDWSPSREYICHTPLQFPAADADLRHDPRPVADVRLDRLPDPAELAGEATWTFAEETTIHGLAYWFDLELGDGVWLSNAPGADPGSWGNLFLPVPEAVTVPRGGTVSARVAPALDGNDLPAWLTWELRSGDFEFRGHEFRSFPASLSDLISSSTSWVPELSEQGRLEREVLRLSDGSRTVDEITAAICGTNPALNITDVRPAVLGVLQGRIRESPTGART